MANASETLPAAQFAILQAFMDVLRPALGQTARVFGTMARVDANYQSAIAPLLAFLQPTDTIDCPTGLAGAQIITAQNLKDMMAQVEGALAAYNTGASIASYQAFAGLVNTI